MIWWIGVATYLALLFWRLDRERPNPKQIDVVFEIAPTRYYFIAGRVLEPSRGEP